MNKLVQNLFSILFPFYPLLAWVLHFVINKPINFLLNLILLPLALYFLANTNKKLPKYLICFLLFTIYHIASSFFTNSIPADQNKVFFIFADIHVFACSLFIVIEHVSFEEKFMLKMTKNIFWIVVLSLIVSIIQIKDPSFFFNTAIDMSLYVGEGDTRNSSIYSWTVINSIGITFPILIAILLNFYQTGTRSFIIVLISGIVVSFLTKSRYVMISALIVFSQLIFTRGVSFFRAISLIFIFVLGLYMMVFVSGELGFDVQEVISNRIFEKENEMGSAKARVTSFEVFGKVFPKSPLFGVGPQTREDVVELMGNEAPIIHIGYLSYLYFYGIAGSFFLFITFFYLLYDLWLVGKKHGFWGSFYGILSFAAANLTFVYFNFSEMGVVLAVLYARYYRDLEIVPDENKEAQVSYS